MKNVYDSYREKLRTPDEAVKIIKSGSRSITRNSANTLDHFRIILLGLLVSIIDEIAYIFENLIFNVNTNRSRTH